MWAAGAAVVNSTVGPFQKTGMGPAQGNQGPGSNRIGSRCRTALTVDPTRSAGGGTVHAVVGPSPGRRIPKGPPLKVLRGSRAHPGGPTLPSGRIRAVGGPRGAGPRKYSGDRDRGAGQKIVQTHCLGTPFKQIEAGIWPTRGTKSGISTGHQHGDRKGPAGTCSAGGEGPAPARAGKQSRAERAGKPPRRAVNLAVDIRFGPVLSGVTRGRDYFPSAGWPRGGGAAAHVDRRPPAGRSGTK